MVSHDEWEVSVDCRAVKQLATRIVNQLGGKGSFCLRVQGALGGVKRETGPSKWGPRRTGRAGEAIWDRVDGTLSWRFESADALRELERRSPKLKLHCYATRGATAEEREIFVRVESHSANGTGMEPTLDNSESLGRLVLELAEIRKQPRQGLWAKLQGPGTPAELQYTARIRQVPSDESSDHSSAAEGEPADETVLPAKRLGRGETLFELCVSVERAGALSGVVGPELEAAASREGRHFKYWFSFELLGVLLQTEQFAASTLDAPELSAECDWFRLRGSAHELAEVLARVVDVFLCTNGLVVAAGRVCLGPLLPVEAWHPARSDAEFFASEQRFRIPMESRRPSAEGAPPGWFELSCKLRRCDVSDRDAIEKRGPLGWVPPPPPPPPSPPPPEEEEGDREVPSQIGDAPLTKAPTALSHEPRLRWRLTLELLEARLEARSAQRMRFRYGAEFLGQKGVAKTARLPTDWADAEAVAVRGKGARAFFEFSRISAAELGELLAPGLVVELAEEETDAVVGTAHIELAAPLLSNQSRSVYSASTPATLTRLLEREYTFSGDGAEPPVIAQLRVRVVIDEQLEEGDSATSEEPQGTWSETVVGRLVGAEEAAAGDDSSSIMSGASGGNRPATLPRHKKKPVVCVVCGAPSDWATRQTEAAIEAERRAWEEWRDAEEAAWASRLRRKEQERLKALEVEAARSRSQERDEASAHRAEYARLEAKLRASLREVEHRERSLRDADAALHRERALRVSELQLLERRLRDETRHAVDAERRHTKALEKTLSTQRAVTERAERRASAAEADLDRWRAAHRRTPEAELAGRLARARAEAADLSARLERARAETAEACADRERLRAQVQRLARALRRERDEAADKARRELDELRLEYRGREERFVLDGDKARLGQIKAELDALRRATNEGQNIGTIARQAAEFTIATLAADKPQPATQALPALADKRLDDQSPSNQRTEDDGQRVSEIRRDSNSNHAGGVPSTNGNDALSYDHLVAERTILVEDAGYPPDDPLVKDLDRLIGQVAPPTSTDFKRSADVDDVPHPGSSPPTLGDVVHPLIVSGEPTGAHPPAIRV